MNAQEQSNFNFGEIKTDLPSTSHGYIDENIIMQIYQQYSQMLQADKNAKVRDILMQEPYANLMQ